MATDQAGLDAARDSVVGPDDDIPDASPPSPSAIETKRAALRAVLGKLAAPVPSLAPRLGAAVTANAVITQELSFASTATWRTEATLRKAIAQPAATTGRLPVAIVLHPTGSDRDDSDVVDLASALVARGFLTVAMSGRYFGSKGNNDAYIAALKAADAHPGSDFPFLYDTAWDVMRLVDYLVTRDDCDPKRIGLTGISKGGMETTIVAAADPRIAAAAPIIGVQSFTWGLEHDAFQARAASLGDAIADPSDATAVRAFYDHVAPGLVDLYDGPDVLPLVSPRPFVVIAGTQDPRNPMPGVQLVMAAARAAYTREGASDRISLFTAEVAHDGSYPPFHTTAVDWLVKWLGQPR